MVIKKYSIILHQEIRLELIIVKNIMMFILGI